jgi:hypothetical protein
MRTHDAAGAPEEIVDEALVHAAFGLRSRALPDPVTGTLMCVPIGRTVEAERVAPIWNQTCESRRSTT